MCDMSGHYRLERKITWIDNLRVLRDANSDRTACENMNGKLIACNHDFNVVQSWSKERITCQAPAAGIALVVGRDRFYAWHVPEFMAGWP